MSAPRRLPMLLLVALLLALPVAAQQSPASPASAQPAASPSNAAQASPAAPDQAQNPAQQGTSAELAETSRHAAEEDENAQFKQSASVRWLASHTGLSPNSAYWVAILFNFVVIAGAIVMLSKSSLPAMFRTRTASIQRGIEEARQSSQDAQRRLHDIEARLSRLDGEIAAMRSSAEAEAVAEEARIRAATEEEAHKIAEAAGQEIEAAARLARRELTSYAADLAVSLAGQRIQVDAATDRVLVRGFVEQLGQSNGSGRKKGER